MKRLIYIATLLLCFTAAFPSFAVTEKEMDRARAIAAKAYLRYANDGSGYLDDINPKSMADLEKALKAKEKENIKAFKGIPVPSDYRSWDKQKLVDYWGVKAFAAKGLAEKGRIGKNRARKALNAMTVSAPEKAEKKPETPAQPTAPVERKSEQASQTASAPDQTAPATNAAPDSLSVAGTPDSAADPLSVDADSDIQLEKASDHTWIYIVILCILVGVVVALVVFASNVMKKNTGKYPVAEREAEPEAAHNQTASNNAMREKYAAIISSKNEEIASLSKKIETLNAQNSSLKSNLEALTAEVAALRTRLAEADKAEQARHRELSNATQAARPQEQAHRQEPARHQEAARPQDPARHTDAPRQEHPSQTPGVRSIFLGRANAKGIFVRADRTLNPGNSIFRLDTTDGYAGSFRVVSNQNVWQTALFSPIESLSGACVAPDITATQGMTKVVNDTAGTAIFEGGCWKVIRKAKIHYE